MLDLNAIRSHFPALATGTVFLDNPGGTQIARMSLQRLTDYLTGCNANHGGAFRTSRDSDAVVDEARAAVADFLGAACPEEIVFGQNMTSLTLHISRSIARMLHPGEEIVVTRLDHDANIAPWMRIAEDCGCMLRWLDFDPQDCRWTVEALEAQLTEKTRLVALGYASNAVGTINPVAEAVRAAHRAGALTFIDAVQYAPHGPIDVQALDCDFLAVSAYKFFGPHTGILYGKLDLLRQLPAYKVRPAGNEPPHKFETGTQSFESIAGVHGALQYLESLGGEPSAGISRRERLEAAMHAIREYEFGLSRTLLEGLGATPGVRIRGVTDIGRLEQRVPTVAFTLEGRTPRQVAAELGQRAINVWDGNYYALEVMEWLGLEGQGGMVRVGAVHYNTLEEIERFLDAVRSL